MTLGRARIGNAYHQEAPKIMLQQLSLWLMAVRQVYDNGLDRPVMSLPQPRASFTNGSALRTVSSDQLPPRPGAASAHLLPPLVRCWCMLLWMQGV